nr:MAG TPA: hypothetical protein [Caudoviricetes sp.]
MKQDNSFVYPALFILLTDKENVSGTAFRRWERRQQHRWQRESMRRGRKTII